MIKKTITIGLALLPILIFTYFMIDDKDEVLQSLSPSPEKRPVPNKYDTLEELFNETIIDTINPQNSQPQLSAKINTDASKIEVLKGTWMISYRIGITSYTDKMVINKTSRTSDGNVIGKGVLYLNQIRSDVPISCGYQPKQLTVDTIEFMCLSSRNTILIAYVFKISENIITLGYIGVSENFTKAIDYIDNESFQITGFRLTPTPQSNYQSTYNLIQWDKRGADNDYCLDIADDDSNLYVGLNPVQCGKNMTHFLPVDYVRKMMHTDLPNGFAFRWRVWSRNVNARGQTLGKPNYAGEGYEGRVVVDQYFSADYQSIR